MEGLSQVLPYAFTIFIGIFIVFGFIVGLIRGLKRSVARLVWLIACIVVLLFTTTLITPAFMNMDVSFMNLSYKGQSASTIKEYTGIMVSSMANTPIENLGTTLDFAIAIASMFINSFIFAIMFFLLRILSLPLYAIINKIFIHDRNKKKMRFFGSLVGAVSGLMIALTFLTPLAGYVSLYSDVKNILAETPEYADMLDDADEFIDVYNNDVAVRVLNSIGLNKVQLFLFDSVSQSKYKDSTFRLMKEKDNLIGALPALIKLDNSSDPDKKADLNDLIEPISSLFDSEIMKTAFIEFSPVIKEKVQEIDMGEEEYALQVKEIIIDLIDKLPELDKKTIQETLNVVASTAKEAEKISDDNKNCNYQFFGEQIDKLISLNVISDEKINNLMYSLAEKFLGSIKEDDEFYEISQNILSKLRAGVKSYGKEMSALSVVFEMTDMLNDEFDFTVNGAEFGAKIDELLVINAEIIDKEFIDDLLASAIDDYAKNSMSGDFGSYVNDIKANLKKVRFYEDEFSYLAKLIDLSSADYSIEKINTPDENGKTLGNKLDEIASSVLVGSIPLDVIGKQLDDYANSPENASYKDILDAVKTNYDTACANSVAKGKKDGVTYSDITSAFDEMYKAMTTAESKIVGKTEFTTDITKSTEDELAKLTQNMLLGENGTRLVAKTVADDILKYIDDKPFLSATQKGKDLLETYKEYLSRSVNLENEPYNGEENIFADKNGIRTDCYSDGLARINRPFTYILEELQLLMA